MRRGRCAKRSRTRRRLALATSTFCLLFVVVFFAQFPHHVLAPLPLRDLRPVELCTSLARIVCRLWSLPRVVQREPFRFAWSTRRQRTIPDHAFGSYAITRVRRGEGRQRACCLRRSVHLHSEMSWRVAYEHNQRASLSRGRRRDVEKCTFLGLQSIVIYGFFHGRFVHSTKRPWKKSYVTIDCNLRLLSRSLRLQPTTA